MRSYLLVTCTLMSVVSADSTCSFFECVDSDNAFRANSDSIFKSCQSLVEETSFVALQKPSVRSNVEPSDTNDSLDQISLTSIQELSEQTYASDSWKETLKKALADRVVSAAYEKLQPEIKAYLWIELRKVISGTGMVALTPDGKELPVVSGTLRGLVDIILLKLGVSNSVRSGVDAVTRVTGYKDEIEESLKKHLRFNSLEAFIERKSQELALKALGFVCEKISSSATMSQLSNIQQSVSLQDGRREYLSGHTAKGDLDFLLGYVWYEMRNILNVSFANAIHNLIENTHEKLLKEVKERVSSMVYGSVGAIAIQGPAGVIAGLSTLALYHKYGTVLIEGAYQAAEDRMISGLTNIVDIAAFGLSKEEIQTYHPVSVEIKTTEGDFVVVESVKEESYRVNILTGAVKNGFGTAVSTAAKVVGKGANFAVSTVRKIGSWFGY